MKKAVDRKPEERIRREIENTAELLRQLAVAKSEVLLKVAKVISKSLQNGHTVYFAGNGGSASQAQHAAGELVGRFAVDRKGYRAAALTADTSILTCVANDYGFEHVFERQIEAMGRKGDVLVCLSTSGRSPNIILAMESARRLGITTVALTGHGGGQLAGRADYLIDFPQGPAWHIQELHLVALHILCGEVERELAGKVSR